MALTGLSAVVASSATLSDSVWRQGVWRHGFAPALDGTFSSLPGGIVRQSIWRDARI